MVNDWRILLGHMLALEVKILSYELHNASFEKACEMIVVLCEFLLALKNNVTIKKFKSEKAMNCLCES